MKSTTTGTSPDKDVVETKEIKETPVTKEYDGYEDVKEPLIDGTYELPSRKQFLLVL